MQPEFKVDVRQHTRSLRRLAAETRRDGAKILRQSGRRVAVNFAFQTQPLGFSAAAHDRGRGRVAADTRRVFATPRDIYRQIALGRGDKETADWFWRAFKDGDTRAMKKAMQVAGIALPVGKTVRKELRGPARNRRGRVPRESYRQLVTDNERLKRFVDRLQKRVGFAKSGWAACAQDLGGTRGIPRWAKGRKVSGYKPGQATAADRGMASSITLRNFVRYVRRIFTPAQEQAALDREVRTQEDLLRRAIEANKRRAGFR